MRPGRAISSAAGAVDSSRSSRRSVSFAAAFNRLENEASGLGLVLAAVRGMEGIVLNLRAMTSFGWSRSRTFHAVRGAILALIFALLLPYLVTPLYRVVN